MLLSQYADGGVSGFYGVWPLDVSYQAFWGMWLAVLHQLLADIHMCLSFNKNLGQGIPVVPFTNIFV